MTKPAAREQAVAALEAFAVRTLDDGPCWCVSDDERHEGWVHAPRCIQAREAVLELAEPDAKLTEAHISRIVEMWQSGAGTAHILAALAAFSDAPEPHFGPEDDKFHHTPAPSDAPEKER